MYESIPAPSPVNRHCWNGFPCSVWIYSDKSSFSQVTSRSWLYAVWIFVLSVIQRLQKRTIAPPRTFFGLLFGEYLTLLSRWNTYLLGLLYCRARGWCISSLSPPPPCTIRHSWTRTKKVGKFSGWLATESGKNLKTSIENKFFILQQWFSKLTWPITNRTSSWYQAEACENAYKSSL